MSILDYFPPGMTPRPDQVALLQAVEAAWDKHDVICIKAPPAFGKTATMYTIAHWQAGMNRTAAIITPDNAIAEQINDKHPGMAILRRRGFYSCAEKQTTCDKVPEEFRTCDHCPAVRARQQALKAPVRLSNLHVYWAYGLHADTAIFDEAHKIVEILASAADVVLPCKKYKLPENLKTCGDLVHALQVREKLQPHDETLQRAYNNLIAIGHAAAAKYFTKWGKRMLRVCGNGPRMANRFLWPRAVSKLVLVSATISDEDVKEMGLDQRRVFYVEAASPIPADRRPVVPLSALNMSVRFRHITVPLLAKLIDALAMRHATKGLIHAPYSVAEQLRAHLMNPRVIWHTKATKAAALREFIDSPPADGRILVASGMYEGIDLPYDAAGWQLITVVPYLSLGDVRVAEQMKSRPRWYAWEAIKRIVQASGRIVRAPDDNGITYIADTCFDRLRRDDQARDEKLFPKFFNEALRNEVI